METYSFAGFTFPKRLAFLRSARKPRALRSGRIVKRPDWCFAYTHQPKPAPDGWSYYLGSDFAPGLRWQWADEVEGSRIRHTGYFTSADGGGDTIRGIVARLPRGRGFLAGNSMGEGMFSVLEAGIFACERDAARRADTIAEGAAQLERERDEAYQAGIRAAEAHSDSVESRRIALAILADIRAAAEGLAADASVEAQSALERNCQRLRAQALERIAEWREARATRDNLKSEWADRDGFRDAYGMESA